MLEITETLNSQSLQKLTTHITEKRWREVFLLTTEMLQSADELLNLMKQQIDELLTEDERLQAFLHWVDEKTVAAVDFDQVPYKYVACRAFYISEFDLLHPLDPKLSHDFATDFEPSVNPDVKRVYDEHEALLIDEMEMEEMWGSAPIWSSGTSSTNKPSIAASTYVRTPALNQSLALDYHFLSWLNETESDVLPVHSLWLDSHRFRELIPLTFDPLLQQKLQTLFNQIQAYRDEDWTYWEQWWKENGKTWAEQLRAVTVQHRNIGHDWQFSDEQKEKLQQYYDANKLLVDCLNSAFALDPNVRQEIEETLLLPIAEIKKRRKNK